MERETMIVDVYCDTTGLYTEDEMNMGNMAGLEFPTEIVREYFNEQYSEMSFDFWYKEYYTCDDTEELYAFATERGYYAPKATRYDGWGWDY